MNSRLYFLLRTCFQVNVRLACKLEAVVVAMSMS